jgi:hypothetical protein
VKSLLSSGASSPSRAGSTREEEQSFLKPDDDDDSPGENDSGTVDIGKPTQIKGKLGFRETARLSFEFCILWVRFFF